jgi:hypothetical protein
MRRDLGRAFTRAIPPASAEDAVWRGLAPGLAGTMEVTITISEAGKVTGRKVPEVAPRHLVSLVDRTLAALQSGTFALKDGIVAAGAQRLVLTATVSDVEVPEGQAGGAFGLKFTYDRGKGRAGHHSRR